MKILYTTNDRHDAQLAADALHGLATDVTVAWAGRLSDAQLWLAENRDLTAIIVEAYVQNQSCAPLVRHVRGLGMTTPILVVTPEDEKAPVAALKAGADDYVPRNTSLLRNLTAVVSRTLQAQAQSPPLRLLYVGDAALARECLESDRHRIQVTEVAPSANGRFQTIPPELLAAGEPLPFDVLLVEHDRPSVHAFAILKDVLARELPIPVIFVVEWDEQIAIPAVKLGAADCVVKSREALRALLLRLDRRRRERPGGAQRWNDLSAENERLHDGERRHATDRAVAAERLSEQQSHYDNRVAELTAARLAVELKLVEADAAVERLSRARLSDAASYAEQLAERDEAITTGLTEVVRMRDVLEKQLGNAALALEQARRDRLAGAAAEAAQLKRHESELAKVDASRQVLEHELRTTRQKLADADQILHEAENRHASALAAAAGRLHEQQAQYEARLAEAAVVHDAVDRRLREATATIESVRQEYLVESTAAAERLSRGEQDLGAANAAIQVLECRLAEAETALHDTERRSTDARLAAEQRAEQLQAEFAARVDQETANREALEQSMGAATKRLALLEAELIETLSHRRLLESRLADATSALRSVDERAAAERLAACQEAAQRQAEFAAEMAQIIAGRHSLERALASSQDELAASEAGLRGAEQRHASAMTSAAAQQAEQQAEYEARLAQAAVVTDAIDRHLHEAETTLERVHYEREAEALAASKRQSELEARLSQELEARHAIEQAMAATRQDLLEAEAALRDIHELHASETASAAAKLTEQHADYAARLAEISAAHAAVEEKLADAERHHVLAMEAAVAEAIAQREHYETRLTEAASAREVVDQQLRDAEAGLGQVRQESASMARAAAEQLAQRESELDAARTAGEALAQQLDAAEAALARAGERATAERAATAQQAAKQQEEFDAQLAREIEARTIVECDLAETRAAAELARRAFLDESGDLAARLAELEARLTEQLARERADNEGKLVVLQEQLGALNAERDVLRESLATSQDRLQVLTGVHEDAVRRLGDEYAAVCHTLERVRADAEHSLERVAREHAAELARVVALVAERDGQLLEQAAHHTASRQESEQTRARLESEHRVALAAHDRQVEQLNREVKDLTRELHATRSHRDVLQTEADRVPTLIGQLDAIRAENRRQFEQSPVGILHCSPAGALLDANPALIAALGYRNVNDLRAVDSLASVCESPDDLRWVIESRGRKPRESIDSIWRSKGGTRLSMRLRAVPISADVIEIVAEDLTSLRAVEERLRQAQRMEAVGRLASEVAVTCDNLLRNASQDGQQWLAAIGGNTAQRHQGELIFGEVTRAASFLRQLSVYGEKQTRALAPVDVNDVLRDLGPILKRVAGDDIELVLPKKAAALNVDVDAERVERVLVNVAAYGRSRMPSGGRLVVQLARVAVDSKFVTRYPNVRQGAHALIRVTEVRAARREDWPSVVGEPAADLAGATTSEHPGVELAPLQGLIRDCGGHLWMKAEPGGDMEVRIHLPLRSQDMSSAAAAPSKRGRSVGRWFMS